MRNKYILHLHLLALIFLGYSQTLYADDPGITKVRLIQQTDSVYLFEADVPRSILSSIQTPVFPERFRISDFEYTDQSGWITLRWRISSSGDPLLPEEEIVLPWLRNGVDFTVQWKNGTTYKGLFNRSLNGIHIPMNEVIPNIKTTLEVLQEGFFAGVGHFAFKLIHVILVLVLAWSFTSRKIWNLFLWYTLGQAITLILAEFRIAEIDLLFSEILIVLSIFIIAYYNVRQREIRFAGIILLTLGIFHGLSYAQEIAVTGLGTIQRVQSLFAFNLAMDLGHLLFGFIFVLVLPYLKRYIQNEKRVAIITGSFSVFLFFLILVDNIAIGQLRILDFGLKKASINIPVTTRPSTGQVQRGVGFMTTPIMVYLSVEPYEIRQEVLVRGTEALTFLDLEYPSGTIPVKDQEQIKSSLSEIIKGRSNIRLGDETQQVAEVTANFVRLSRGGVSIRETPMEENLEESIIGITYIYDIESFPDSLYFDWQLFGESVETVEASIVDPHGALTINLDAENHSIKWESRLSGFQLPAVEPIVIERYALPLMSIILFLGIIVIMIYLFARKSTVLLSRWMILVLVIAFVIYPFVRVKAAVPFMPEWKPSKERTSIILNDLLSNIYRAFDRRKEDDVYDRLAMSVTGDQLTNIYLQNRQAMALENRGGARANVDEINILNIHEITSGEDGFIVDASWTVRGSVNHFGHTHYRQNQYRALVNFISENEVWKINSIETLDEKRIY